MKKFITDATPEEICERYAALKEQAAQADYGELDEDVVIIDTETTGFSFNHDELTQIAAARMVHGEITDWFVTFVNPGKPIPDDVAHLTNIHDEDVANAPSPVEACARLAEFVGDSDVVAHNTGFDKTFVTKNEGGACLADNVWIDSLDLARIALPRLRSHRLIDLVHTFGAPVSTHRADDDVAATCGVYRVLLAAVAAMPPELVAYISELATVEEWPTVKVFKHFAQAYCDRKNASDAANESPAEKTTSPELVSDLDWVDEALAVMKTETASENGSQGVLFEEALTPAKLAKKLDLKKLRRERVGKIQSKAKIDAETIEQDPMRDFTFPSEAEVVDAFTPEGLVGSLYERYESRSEQIEMSKRVRAAFAGSTNLAVEAGTGVGKSMAYLVPSALTARANGITVGVATKTNALLDQLVHKELPLLSESFEKKTGKPLAYAPLKGFSHYPCLRRVQNIQNEGASFKDVAGKSVTNAPAIAGLLSFIEQSAYDDMDTLKIDYRTLPRYLITTSSNDCMRRKCPFYGDQCFVHGARRKAEGADIIVTNHSLLFCDVAADGGLLPAVRYWIVDEAHGAENEARRALSPSLSADAMMRLAQKVGRAEGRSVFTRIETVAAKAEEGSTLILGLSSKARSKGADFATAASELAVHMKDLLFFDESKRSRGYEYVDLWINEDIRASETFKAVVSHARVFYDAAEAFVRAGQDLVSALDGIDGSAVPQKELASAVLEAKDMLQSSEIIFFDPSPRYAYAAHMSRKKDHIVETYQALLVNVGDVLNERLYEQTHSVVYASATLSIADDFKAFESAVGLNASEASRAETCQLASSYDYDRNMTVYVVEDMPEPNDPHYLRALQELLISSHRAQRGSMLTLFTNRKEMESCFNVVQPALKADQLRLVCQKWGVSVKGLRDDFLADKHLSLFALKSFWEGFDAPGATLRGVIIPKLPFNKPSDPLSCERSERDAQAWSHYVLPAAVIETKQAAGRLIRSADDEGVLILADKRLLTKGYGKVFLRSMPSKNIKTVKIAELAEELELRSKE